MRMLKLLIAPSGRTQEDSEKLVTVGTLVLNVVHAVKHVWSPGKTTATIMII